MTKKEKREKARQLANTYIEYKGKKLPSHLRGRVRGFIIKNMITDKTPIELDELIKNAEKLHDGALFGEGDKFKRWCQKLGRKVPSNDLVELMNGDPHDAGIAVKKAIPEDSEVYRNYCSYLSGRGRALV